MIISMLSSSSSQMITPKVQNNVMSVIIQPDDNAYAFIQPDDNSKYKENLSPSQMITSRLSFSAR